MNGLLVRFCRPALPALMAAVFIFGCERGVTSLDEGDFRDPLLRKAQARIRQGDKAGAISCLNKALARKPELAQADLELALLYDDYKKDYIRAIYHYQRYLELRPAAQKRLLIEDLIRKAKMSLAASISDQYPELGRKLPALEEENARLKASLRELRENLAKRLKSSGAREPSAGADRPAPVETLAPTSAVYCVQAGDTLSAIAAKVYNNPRKWRTILEANSNSLPAPDRLKSGLILNIPR